MLTHIRWLGIFAGKTKVGVTGLSHFLVNLYGCLPSPIAVFVDVRNYTMGWAVARNNLVGGAVIDGSHTGRRLVLIKERFSFFGVLTKIFL
jgi:hypothetical protein